MIAATKDKKAGAIIVAGTFLIMFALGLNTIYSIQTFCLETDPPRCFSGYDGLFDVQRILLTPVLYVIGIAAIILGGTLWLRKDRAIETHRV